MITKFLLTSPMPINTRQAMRRYGLARAETGVNKVNTVTPTIPIDIITRGPNRSANHPPGNCRAV